MRTSTFGLATVCASLLKNSLSVDVTVASPLTTHTKRSVAAPARPIHASASVSTSMPGESTSTKEEEHRMEETLEAEVRGKSTLMVESGGRLWLPRAEAKSNKDLWSD